MYKELITFKNIPLSNSLITDKNEDVKCYDLKVGFDEETKLVSLIDNVSPKKLFPDDYVYDSSQSKTMVNHFKNCAYSLQNRFNCDRVLEIGSNSGIFIKHFNPDTTIAVEPCSNFADITNDMEYKTYDDFWGKDLSELIKQEHGTMDLIFSSNTISHIQGLDECLSSVRRCLSDDGVFVVECPSFLELIKYNAFDQFYHEHQSYFSLISFENILKKNGLKLFDIELHSVHGGSYRYFICKDINDSFNSNKENLEKWKTEEKEFGVDSYNVLKNVMNTIKKNINEIKNKLETLKSEGKKVIGYGATAKFTQVSNMCELNSELINFVVDTTPDKHNKYIPKSNIKILPYNDNSLEDIDYCYLGAWNFKDEILEKENSFLNSGGKFITHIPDVRVI
jgi:SAM-dependent methyltransferase